MEGFRKLSEAAYLDAQTRTHLHHVLGYPDEARIPESEFKAILNAKPGTKVHNVEVTKYLKEEVRRALNSRNGVPRYGRGRLLGRRFR